jgi:GntR family transcriptional repressor for pyruvate dehydrogenase complex
MTTTFKPIKPKKISEEIVEQIKALISNGELKPGERIPSERELASALKVSRPSVREAIMVLDATGFVESKQGGGTFVRSMADPSMADPLASLVGEKDPKTLYALTEVRMGLETWSAYLAAERATDEEIAAIRSLYETMEEQAKRGGWDADIDAQFHFAITSATHNTIQMHVMNTIHSLFHTTIQVALTELYRKEGYLEKLLKQHWDILTAIEKRDPLKAQKAMFDHLSVVEKKLGEMLDK